MEKFKPDQQDISPESSLEKGRETMLFCRPDELSGRLSEFSAQSSPEEFFKKVCSDADMLAQVSYWEKWLTREQASLLERTRLEQRNEVRKKELPLGLETRFDEEERELIFSNVSAIQLSVGCSIGCPHCGFDAIKGVKEEIPYEQLNNMFQRYGKMIQKGEPFLYWASEPSDYYSKDKDGNEKRYKDVHELAVNEAGYVPAVTTQNHDKSWIDQMREIKRKQELISSSEFRISTHGLSDDELLELEEQNEEENLRIIDSKMNSGVRKKVIGMGITQKKQENLDSDIPKSGIACVDGILITPRGLYGMVVVPISKEFPQGQIIMPLHEISDRPIKVGDNMKEVLTRAIAETKYSHQGAGLDEGQQYQKFNKSHVRRHADVFTGENTHSVFFDGMTGDVIDSILLLKEPEQYLQENEDRIISLAGKEKSIEVSLKEIITIIFSLLRKIRKEIPYFDHKVNDVYRSKIIIDELFEASKESDIEKVVDLIKRIKRHVQTSSVFAKMDNLQVEKSAEDFKKNLDMILEVVSKVEEVSKGE
ncbi:MAG: hypothetical protein RLZZ517_621 [Candidatus Parcubacteria bacterium]|jgi:hypothetical protein